MRRLVLPLVATISFVLAGPAVGQDGDEKDVYKAKLLPTADDPSPLVHGKAKRKIRLEEGDFRDRFKAKVEMPYPDNGLGIDTREKAAEADIRVVLARGGTPYAVCFLLLEDDDDLHDSEVEFKADLRFRGGALERLRGECDVDLATEGAQNGIPDLLPGDTASAVLVEEGVSQSLASGTVVQIR